MDTFPPIEPVYAISKETNPLSKKAGLGDGYLKRTIFTLNSIKPQWSIQWLVSASDASTIDLFLKQHSEDGEWFYWTPPDGLSADKWRCDEWTVEHLADSLVRINASFRQVFELILNEQIPEEYLCPGTPALPVDTVYGSPLTLTGCDANDLIQWYCIAPDGTTTEAISGATGCTYAPSANLIGYQVYAVSNGTQTNSTTVRGITPYFSQGCSPNMNVSLVVETFGWLKRVYCPNGNITYIPDDPNYTFYPSYTNIKKVYTFTSDSDGTKKSPVWYQTRECTGVRPPIRRNGVISWTLCGSTSENASSLWGGNLSILSSNTSYQSYHGSVITSITLTQNHPYYGQAGTDILAIGLQEAVENGDPYWDIYG